MKTEDLIRDLRKAARMFSAEPLWLLLSEAAEQLGIYTEPKEARLLTLEEIEKAPDYTLIYEEVRIDWRACHVESMKEDKVEYNFAPVEKRGDKLFGSGMDTDICPDMFGESGSECQVRYWLGRPTDEQREATPWE